MQRIPLPRLACRRLPGVVDIDERAEGISPRRLSDTWRYQLPIDVDILASSPTGVRLVFATTSKTVGVEVLATHFKLGAEVRRSRQRSTSSRDNELVASQRSPKAT